MRWTCIWAYSIWIGAGARKSLIVPMTSSVCDMVVRYTRMEASDQGRSGVSRGIEGVHDDVVRFRTMTTYGMNERGKSGGGVRVSIGRGWADGALGRDAMRRLS